MRHSSHFAHCKSAAPLAALFSTPPSNATRQQRRRPKQSARNAKKPRKGLKAVETGQKKRRPLLTHIYVNGIEVFRASHAEEFTKVNITLGITGRSAQIQNCDLMNLMCINNAPHVTIIFTET